MSKNNADTVPITPAEPAFHADGTPYSPLFDDIYHSAAGAFEQAHHVFITGNTLIERWAQHEKKHFVILETGFGLGVNFLATWMAWRQAPKRATHLHFVSIEKHPFIQADLHELLLSIAPSSLHPFIVEICNQWPVLTPGLHRLEFDKGHVVLTLCLGDISTLCPQLQLQADAFYLDGFAPSKNPEMWTPEVCKWLAKLAHEKATLATYTVAGDVRRSLNQVGFEVQKIPGFKKRAMLVGHFAPRWHIRRPSPIKFQSHPSYNNNDSERHALVIGAGLAGCAITQALTRRGWEVSLIEQCKQEAQQTSRISLGLFHPAITQDNSLFSRATRAGFLCALQHFKKLSAAHLIDREIWKATGLLKIAKNEEESRALHALACKLAYPKNFVIPVSAQEASERAGTLINSNGWYFPEGGWVNPSALCQAQLLQAGVHLKTYFEKRLTQLIWHSNRWHAIDENARVIASAPIAILASAQGTSSLLKILHTHLPPTQEIRGQLTTLRLSNAVSSTRFNNFHNLNLPVLGNGYVIPTHHGDNSLQEVLIGASYDRDDSNAQPTISSYHGNLARLTKLLPTFLSNSHEAGQYAPIHQDLLLYEQVAFRCASKDRLPLLGSIFEKAAWNITKASNAGAHLSDLPRFTGLFGAWAYGSRGLIWATLCAELLASQLEGEPLPVENTIAAAFDPARFFLRQLRNNYAKG